MEPERRRAVLEALREAARLIAETREAVEEAKREALRSLEEALGIPLTEEGAVLRRLYDFVPPPQPGLEELRRRVLESLGVEGGEEIDVLEALRRLGAGGSGSEPVRRGGEGDTGDSHEARR